MDALRVFSESQINILGIAAFAVRSKLMGHKMIILDDPVREDHFKTFCTQPPPPHPPGYEDYVTMEVRHSRREGCIIEEGNRRVAERLKKAEKLSEEGKWCLANQ
ncbi:hypothetical protein [Candidatus Villigracilis affinis]|uniref:hypothetical protein n=1 Tax=Candidatus Villigracilis affinis TaxID=3140682 RepID=UPI002A1DAE39|nr:hypothetical protein [Anaerolineales bacterium]